MIYRKKNFAERSGNVIAAVLILTVMFAFTGCGKEVSKNANKPNLEKITPTGKTTKITEKLYISYVNEIYENPSEYLGNTIDITGMFSTQTVKGEKCYFVYRAGPGCCGNDGSLCGFEIVPEDVKKIPKENEWINVKGMISRFEIDGAPFLRIEDAKIKKVSPEKAVIKH